MDQDASGWKTLLTRANQLVRSATHPAAELPVEGHLPGFDGATGWVNSPPLTAAELRGRVVLVNRFGEGDYEMSEMVLEITFLDPDVQAYAFTFG
jgi:hypothetical protein